MDKLERQTEARSLEGETGSAVHQANASMFQHNGHRGAVTEIHKSPPTRARISMAANQARAGHAFVRESEALTVDQVGNLKAAAAFSNRIGLPLNRHSIAHFGLLGLDDREGFRAMQNLLATMRGWCWRQGETFAYTWVRERAEHGPHVHMLLHVPAPIEAPFARSQWRWMKKACDGRYSRGAFFSRPVVGWAAYRRGEPAVFERNQSAVINYTLKGAEHKAAGYHRIRTPQDGGRIIGKRCGTSQNIGRNAQAAVAL